MKFCLSSRVSGKYLQQADEIKVAARDHRSIPDLFEKYPQANVILELDRVHKEKVTEQDLIDYNVLGQGRFIACIDDIHNMAMINFLTENKIKYYWGYPINTACVLNSVKRFTNAEYVVVGAPLFFKMDIIDKYGIPVRHCVNRPYMDYLPHDNGIVGCWIRPEDLGTYEPTVQVVEFEADSIEQEEALFRIYKAGKWSGNLEYLIKDLGQETTNRMIPPSLAVRRKNCGQRCLEDGRCKLCYTNFNLANKKLAFYQKYKENKEEM